ncbi:hypothetical protein M0R45_021434 [Rubus argutus]|uniref:CPL3 ARM repeat domain-containing protein n=1 Tax=Rubus argutus TaxID=59490 RepID=A0AAW1XD41_RUBAR
MVVGGSNFTGWNNFKEIEETLGEDFVKQEAKVLNSNGGGDAARVWTMRDIYNYPGFRGYGSGLVNLAWAQAVQNKPLNELFVMDVDSDEKSKQPPQQHQRSSSSLPVNSGNAKAVDKVVILDSGDEMDVEKEEGELEEEAGLKNEVWPKRVNLLREALQTVTVIEAEKSFRDVCLRFLNSLESLRGVLLEITVPTKEALVQQLFTAVQAISSVFCSMSPDRKEQNRDVLSRLLSSVKNDPSPFPAEQIKEIEVMISSIESPTVSPQTKAGINENGIQIINGVNNKDSDTSVANASHVFTYSPYNASDFVPVSVVHNNPIISSEVPRPGASSFKGRGLMLPLLDLHMDHDEDSLPSPTREPPACFPVQKPLAVSDGCIKKPGLETARVALDAEGSKMHVYETEALKAVSTYQQKFSRSSFLTSELPSPTPSEEGDNGDDDTIGEVSSSSASSNSTTPPIPPFWVVKWFLLLLLSWRVVPASKDQLLQKLLPVNQTLENKEADPRKVVNVSSSLGNVEGNSNAQNSANEQVPLRAASSASLPALLKDIAVNPTMLINILKLGQQQRAAEAQQKAAVPAENMTYPPSSSSIPGAAALVNDPSKTSGALQTPTVSSQKATTDEQEKSA